MTVFIISIFLSAFLLFSIQPILGKLLLPYLGGGPTVWNTAMMVYQALLLAGYSYAHLIRDRLGGRTHVRVHLGLLTVSLLTMPVVLVTGVWADPTVQPALWAGAFAVGVGGPAVLPPVGERAPDPELVRRQRPSAGGESLFSL